MTIIEMLQIPSTYFHETMPCPLVDKSQRLGRNAFSQLVLKILKYCFIIKLFPNVPDCIHIPDAIFIISMDILTIPSLLAFGNISFMK